MSVLQASGLFSAVKTYLIDLVGILCPIIDSQLPLYVRDRLQSFGAMSLYSSHIQALSVLLDFGSIASRQSDAQPTIDDGLLN
ncbi:hypothetical protein MIB92_07575 [Aestuariirhabdus sp. Z084]|uniref:hypothetical protein n=1 Tax=Aestuariirhabdus haliotis TaxID=2918751 RepID=UPI00201B380A|nr:hypothetical protein [Aestuariirhabdus haliotis]MCL6415504.1 hypothetical protein [Aestuariirhabdus haliotis]MCL6419291.1 hypothetical protein [Aestuariirhabdus haliotis]